MIVSGQQKKRLLSIISRFPQARILVVGDVMADEYIWGTVSRISPEAPVPVVLSNSEEIILGGATNVVNNIYTLGGGVRISGVIGDDRMADVLCELLRERDIDTAGLVRDPSRPSTIKTRIIAHSQHVVRLDRESTEDLSPSIRQQILDYIQANLPTTDALVISDYGKGIVTPQLLSSIRELSQRREIPLAVDPKDTRFMDYRGVTIITPNHHEASRVFNIQIDSMENLLKVGKLIIDALDCEVLLITRGEEGMSLFRKDGAVTHIPTVTREVYDVTGAGDTVISAFILAFVSGASWEEAAIISNFAAGIVVGEVGTATTTADKLSEVINSA